jgi:predicted transcriptional regulator
MSRSKDERLSRRERQIMNVLFRRNEATVSDVLGELPDPPSYSAVRATLAVLEEKGHIRHRKDGRRFVYAPTVARNRARRSALKQLLTTFFDDSAEGAVAALLEMKSDELSADELDRLQSMIDEARKEER